MCLILTPQIRLPLGLLFIIEIIQLKTLYPINCTKITYLLRPSLQLHFVVTQKYIQMIYLFLYCRALISTLLLRTSVHLSENNISYGSYTHNTQPSKFKQPPSPLLGLGFLTVSQSFLDQFSKSLSKTPFFQMVGCTTKPVSNQ